MARVNSKFRLALLATAALSCSWPAAVLAGPAQPPATSVAILAPSATPIVVARPVRPRWGDINPFWGDINPFGGSAIPTAGTTAPRWGDINPFWGDINPFWGDINPFWGDINPFAGSTKAFWGDINPFNGATTPSGSAGLTPLWGDINPFWQATGTQWASLRTGWSALGATSAATDKAAVAAQMRQMVAASENFWGAAVQSQTGKSFQAGFAQPLLAKYGIDLAKPDTLTALDDRTRQGFFFEWYDGLMSFSGRDRVDHWMATVNWNPSLTVQQGAGRRSVVGLLDFSVAGDADVLNNITKTAGISTYTTGHGAAVASLIVSAHDGRGVMGIAPMASIVAYNPFDSSGTAGWSDIANGLVNLNTNKASIVNMSLGVPGMTLDQGWSGVFSDARLANALKSTVYVAAAGNDGISQTQNVVWNYAANPALIVVGSVDAAETISSFSNRPGSACLTDGGVCKAGGALMNRFIVAPGELLLVSDDRGGVMRASGTSFAAPLVSGAIALLHNRWPWLAAKPTETASIILGSARDLGAPGVDPVYGVGLLDVTASQSPLSFDKLDWYSMDGKGKLKTLSAGDVRRPNDLAKWQTEGKFFYAYETIGSTFRDFAIPLSTKLVGLTTATYDGSQQMFQSYLTGRLTDWIKASSSNSDSGGKGGKFASRNAFSSFTTASAPVKLGGYDVSMSLAPRTPTPGFRQSVSVPYQSSLLVSAPDNHFAARIGYGDGAVALGGQGGFGLVSDYDASFGGANPLLGMASGSGYANVEVEVAPRLRVSAGVTERHLVRDVQAASQADRPALDRVGDYQAGAQHFSLAYDFSDAVTVRAGYTRLRETSALLGIQSLDPDDFAGGSTTQGASLGAEIRPGAGFVLSGSATVGRTTTGGTSQFRTGSGLIGTAFEGAITKQHVFDTNDRLRVSLAQPLYLERGTLDFTSVVVVDRQTGELGQVTQSFDITRPRRQLVGELLYARTLLNGAGEFDLFGRVQKHNDAVASGVSSVMAGGRVRVGF